jgi:hypothetical protein
MPVSTILRPKCHPGRNVFFPCLAHESPPRTRDAERLPHPRVCSLRRRIWPSSASADASGNLRHTSRPHPAGSPPLLPRPHGSPPPGRRRTMSSSSCRSTSRRRLGQLGACAPAQQQELARPPAGSAAMDASARPPLSGDHLLRAEPAVLRRPGASLTNCSPFSCLPEQLAENHLLAVLHISLFGKTAAHSGRTRCSCKWRAVDYIRQTQ